MFKPYIDTRTVTAFLLFILVFLVYLVQLCPTPYMDDSGEIAAAAMSLGIPHPPAYPLYTLLAGTAAFLPLGNAVFRVELLAALGCVDLVVVFGNEVFGLVEDAHRRFLSSGPANRSRDGSG